MELFNTDIVLNREETMKIVKDFIKKEHEYARDGLGSYTLMLDRSKNQTIYNESPGSTLENYVGYSLENVKTFDVSGQRENELWAYEWPTFKSVMQKLYRLHSNQMLALCFNLICSTTGQLDTDDSFQVGKFDTKLMFPSWTLIYLTISRVDDDHFRYGIVYEDMNAVMTGSFGEKQDILMYRVIERYIEKTTGVHLHKKIA